MRMEAWGDDPADWPRSLVYVVNRLNEVDGGYVFEDEAQARRFAERFGDGAVLSEKVIIRAGAEGEAFLAETGEGDELESNQAQAG
jgi:hypothetical protein